MESSSIAPIHCPACGSSQITASKGVFGNGAVGKALGFMDTERHRFCLDCGYHLEFLAPTQLEAMRKHHGLVAKPQPPDAEL